MPLQRFELPRPEGGFEARFWEPLNKPVVGSEGKILYLLHRIVDRTLQHTQGTQLRGAASLIRIAGRVAQIGGWSVDLGTGEIRWSDEVCDIHGMPRGFSPTVDEGFGFYAPEHREQIAEAFRSCADSGTPFDDEFDIIATGGRRVPVRVIGEAIRDATGRIIRVQGALQDLTRIRSTELALLSSQRRFHQLADSMGMIVWTAVPDGTIDFVNQAFCDFTGITRDDLIHGGWMSTIHPADIPSLREAWPAAVASGDTYSLNFRMRRHDGTYRWHHTTARPVAEQEELIRWYGTCIDVEDVLEAGRRARAVADELTETLNSMIEGFYSLDADWRFTFVNPAAEVMLQKTRDELLGRVLWESFPEARDGVVYDAYTTASETGAPQFFDVDYEPLGIWVEVSVYPSSGRLAVYFRDVTQARRAEAAIRLSEERFRAITRATSDVVWDWDLSTDFIWWNDGMLDLFGFDQEAL
ncbi:MAG: PAS domain S-box protein, partial [Dehalococcoidia bacterium]